MIERFRALDAVRALEQMDRKFRSEVLRVQTDVFKAAGDEKAQSDILKQAKILNKSVAK